MAFSLGQRLRATRKLLGMTQEQAIEQLEIRYDIIMSQQTLSTIENGKRKVDAERELPAFAGVYGRSIDYFYETLKLLSTPPSLVLAKSKPTITVDLDALTHRDKLELAVELIHHVLQET